MERPLPQPWRGPRDPAELAWAVAGGRGAGQARRAEAFSRVTAPGGGGKMRLRLLALAAAVLLGPAPGKGGAAGGCAGGRGSSGRGGQGCAGSWRRTPPGRSWRRNSADPGLRGRSPSAAGVPRWGPALGTAPGPFRTAGRGAQGEPSRIGTPSWQLFSVFRSSQDPRLLPAPTSL